MRWAAASTIPWANLTVFKNRSIAKTGRDTLPAKLCKRSSTDACKKPFRAAQPMSSATDFAHIRRRATTSRTICSCSHSKVDGAYFRCRSTSAAMRQMVVPTRVNSPTKRPSLNIRRVFVIVIRFRSAAVKLVAPSPVTKRVFGSIPCIHSTSRSEYWTTLNSLSRPWWVCSVARRRSAKGFDCAFASVSAARTERSRKRPRRPSGPGRSRRRNTG
mmetsp:Transcript_31633/g.97774  ORF Transcript_31633/g.97774 Transcript_31633/m.97774 type:complete len:216 (-) Transcript_31633:65-712(-)